MAQRKSFFRRLVLKFFAGLDPSSPRIWHTIGGTGVPEDPARPTPEQLVAGFTDTAYACTSLIANSVATIPVRLVSPRPTNKYASRRLDQWEVKNLKTKAHTELLDHPALELLRNPSPGKTWHDLAGTHELYLDVVGRSFWLLTLDPADDLPSRIDVLPAHLVTTVYDEETGETLGYQMGEKKDDDLPTFGTEDKPRRDEDGYVRYVIAFRNYPELDEQREGISPLAAVWQKVKLSHQELASWNIIVQQMARPLFMLSPKDANALWSPETSERLAKEFMQRFWGAGQGGVYANGEATELTPITMPPKDTTGLLLQDDLKTSICNAFHVPRPLLDLQDSNFASAKTAERSFQLWSLQPRMHKLCRGVTQHIVRKFDDCLELIPENFIQQDEALELQQRQMALAEYQAGVRSKNETRSASNLPLLAQDEFAPQQMASGSIASFKNLKKKGLSYDDYPLKPVVQVLQKWNAKLEDHVLKNLNLTKADKDFVDLGQYAEGMADDLYAAMKVYYDGAARSTVVKLGLTPDAWSVIHPKVDEAARKASLDLAQSTLDTTQLKVNEAKDQLREQLAQGLGSGEYVHQLSDRVKTIFTQASDERAFLIADTERTRAISNSELTVAQEAGVKKKQWLADSMACDLCRELDGMEIDIDEPFAVLPEGGPYSVIQHPPRHCSCRCGLAYEYND